LKLYAQSNEWDETDSKQLKISPCPILNYAYTIQSCLNCVDSTSVFKEGLAFSRSGHLITFKLGTNRVQYEVNADSTIGEKTTVPFPSYDQWDDLNLNSGLPKPTGGRAALSDNGTKLAVSAPYTTHEKVLFIGAISFYNKDGMSWTLDETDYGTRAYQFLGYESIQFIGEDELEVVSGHSKYDYFVNVLVSFIAILSRILILKSNPICFLFVFRIPAQHIQQKLVVNANAIKDILLQTLRSH